MSINDIQIRRVAEEIARYYFATGVVPTDSQIKMALSSYFSSNPVGKPLPIPDGTAQSNTRSNIDLFNKALANVVMNFEVLYETSEEQIDDILNLFCTLKTRLDSLNKRRARLSALVNDYLLSQSNSDGYYFSISDNFADLSMTDLNFTSAYVNTAAGTVTLPSYSGLTNALPISAFSMPTISVTVNGSPFSAYKTIYPWAGAVNSHDNMAWGIQVVLNQPSEVIVNVSFTIQPATLNQINLTPYGVAPVQAWFNAGQSTFQNSSSLVPFGNINTSAQQMVFNTTPMLVNTVQMSLRKTQADQVDSSTGTTLYSYLFGAQHLQLINQIYDTFATWVSQPLKFPPDLQNELVIQAVSLSSTATTPPGTSINYYAAADSGQTDFDTFQWKPITAVNDANQNSNVNQILSFNGAQSFIQNIKATPGINDLQLIARDPTNSDPDKANPTTNIIPGAEIYKICKLTANVSYKSISLMEGVNAIRIYAVPFSNSILDAADSWTSSALIAGDTMLLSDWATLINGSSPPNIIYGQIDSGQSFFYGGDVGESGQNIYLETFFNIDSTTPPPTIVSNFIKNDLNSQTWSVNLYLNGNPVASLPAGIDNLMVPWVFQAGLNHIALTIQIPLPSITVPNPYLGNITLMADHNLYDFGEVYLNRWSEVSLFELQYNQINDKPLFANDNGLLVSRRAPASNFRITYSVDTGKGPDAIRLRADLGANNNISGVSPQLDSYQIRFAY